MTITQKLSLSFSLLCAALVASIFMAFFVISGFQDRFNFVNDNTGPSIINLGDRIARSNELIIWMYRHQSATDLSKQAEIEKTLYEKINELKTITKYYLDSFIVNDDDRKMTEDALDKIKDIETKLPPFLEGSRAQNDKISLGELQGKNGAGQATRDLIDINKKQIQFNIKLNEDVAKDNKRIYTTTVWSMITISSIVIFILGLMALRTILSIRSGLNSMRDTMEEASLKLNLTLKADDTRKDEIGLTARAYNTLADNVANALASVSISSHSVSTAAEQIAAGNESLSSRTEEQAASLEQTASSMTQLSETVRQTAENTRIASQLSQNARGISEDSSIKVKTMLSTMTDIKNSSSKITDIISLIEGIAFQTNILALNAAVEAARAGEQGRGFAVVAGEVRNLAQRSSSSAREIKDLIETSISFIESGTSQAEYMGKNIEQMDDAINQVTDLVNEISAAAQEQSLGIEQVHQAVSQMDDVTQQNATLVEEASAASHSLKDQAISLNRLVSKFILDKNNHQIQERTVLANTGLSESVDSWSNF